MELKQLNQDYNDSVAEVPTSILRHCRMVLSEIKSNRFRPTEICLAISMFASGGILTAWQGGIGRIPEYWWVFYTILPMIAVAGIVAYFFLGHIGNAEPALKARGLLDILPDPDVVTPVMEETQKLAGDWSLESKTHTSNKKSSGHLNFIVQHGKITITGLMYGESETKFAEVGSISCEYDPAKKHIIARYRLSAFNDDNTHSIHECTFSGIVFNDNDEDNRKIAVKGNWFHLTGPPVSGTIILTKKL